MINEATTLVSLILRTTSNVVLNASEIVNYIWDDMLSTWEATESTWDTLELQNTPTFTEITNITI